MLWQCQAHCVTVCGTLNSAIYMTRKLVFAFKKITNMICRMSKKMGEELQLFFEKVAKLPSLREE